MTTIPESKPGVDIAKGSIPAARTTPSKPNPEKQRLSEHEQPLEFAGKTEFRPQSSPKRLTLTKAEAASLAAVLEYLGDEVTAYEREDFPAASHIGRHVGILRSLFRHTTPTP